MNIASTRLLSHVKYAAGCLHALIFAYYFTGVEGAQFEEGMVVPKIFLAYKIGVGIMAVCWLLRRIRFTAKIVVCVLFIISSSPLIIYITSPVLIKIIFGGIWYGQVRYVNFDGIAIADILAIFSFSAAFLSERSDKVQAAN